MPQWPVSDKLYHWGISYFYGELLVAWYGVSVSVIFTYDPELRSCDFLGGSMILIPLTWGFTMGLVLPTYHYRDIKENLDCHFMVSWVIWFFRFWFGNRLHSTWDWSRTNTWTRELTGNGNIYPSLVYTRNIKVW